MSYGVGATNQVSVGNTQTKICSEKGEREAVVIFNSSTTVTVYIGENGITSSTGHILPPQASITIPVHSTIYGITASSTATVSFLELI